MSKMIELKNFKKCENSHAPIWMMSYEEVELNVPGDYSGPYVWAVEFLRQVWPLLSNGKHQALRAFSEFIKLGDLWYLDAVAIIQTERNSNEKRIDLQFSNPDDVYGLWTAKFIFKESGLVFEGFERIQS